MAIADPRIDFFNVHAATWDTHGQNAAATVARLAELAPLLGLSAGDDLIEVGCGTGQITGWLADGVRPGRVTAIDFAPAMLAAARAKGIDADFMELDICRAAARSGLGPFDVALCFHSFPHFRDQLVALLNLARLLKPAGRLLIVHLAGSRHINQFHASVEGAVNQDVLPAGDAWPPLLAAAGFHQANLIDREELFLLEALRDGKLAGAEVQ